jgi:hypothetical protein
MFVRTTQIFVRTIMMTRTRMGRLLCDQALRAAQVHNCESIVHPNLAKHSVNVILDCLFGDI